MKISLDPARLSRYKDIAKLLVRHGRSDLVANSGLDAALGPGWAELPEEDGADAERAERLVADLEALGPTFIKLGQFLSTRPDLLPAAYIDALGKLQDRVEPFSIADAERIIGEELGVRVSKAFEHLDPQPLAAASLGQVHRAVLRDGRVVAVKVQRPGIRETIVADLEVIADLCEMVDDHTEAGRRYGFGDMLEQYRRALMRELDYRIEAANLKALGRNLAEFDGILVPQPVDDYTAARVLTMDLVRGRKITALSPLALQEVDAKGLADQLFRAYLEQIIVDGFFHADPHPGNVFLTDDRRIALIDLGMVERLSEPIRERLLRLLVSVAEGRGHEAAQQGLALSTKLEDADTDAFLRDVGRLIDDASGIRPGSAGTVVLQISAIGARHGIRTNQELVLLGKTLLNLDEVGRALDPDFEPDAALRRHAADLMQRRMRKSLSPGNLFSAAVEMNELAQELPGRVNRLFDKVLDDDFEISIRLHESTEMLEGMHKIANRIAVGLIIAASIVGAALLTTVQTDFTILGYPGLAVLLFLIAFGSGVYLVIDIMRRD